MNKKFLAKLLIFCMIFTMIPMTAFGATGTNDNYIVADDTTTYTISEDTNLEDLLTNENVTVKGTGDLQVGAFTLAGKDTKTLTIEEMTLAQAAGADKIQFTVPTDKALTLNKVTAFEAVYIVAADADAVARALAADVTPTVTINGGEYAKDIYVTSDKEAFVLAVTSLTSGKVYIAKGFEGKVYLDGKQITESEGSVVFETSGGSTGGGGSSSNVSIATKVTGGKVTVTPTRPTRGQTVTITVTPADGYKLDSLTVTDLKGNTIELTKVSDTKYTFVMPAGKVKVTPVFVKIDGSDKDNTTNVDKRFSDVSADAWYAEYINYVAENGLMNGYEDGRFGPNDNVTREQIAAILFRYAEYKGYDTTLTGNVASFSDAAKVSGWANKAIGWAIGEGLMNGDNGALRPQGNATRAEIAALLMRFSENIAK